MEPDTRPLKPTPPPPTLNEARLRAEQDDRLRQRRGRSATFLSSALGRAEGGVATRTLMG
ncbi:hypothetical protein GVN21_19030 [Caulobacter sp. SLTY]|uniref:hypothetical protein n=1 Tax=Caulobacter sp. SLTY TaxID=2683262 RepID=UPI001412D563|nr:hypothetical protein [Caulobacter sp. SLTY]NBB17459.1 hypothetical protein [Caulobacter sp. SLTY]